MTPTLSQVLIAIAVKDPDQIERIKWEIKNSIGKSSIVGEWPNRNISVLGSSRELFMYNSLGQWIATFKLKALK